MTHSVSFINNKNAKINHKNHPFFLAFQSTDTHIEIASFQDTQLINHSCITKLHASAHFIECLEKLLKEASLSIFNISLCIVNRGPSPFTLLRTMLSYLNGLQAAINLPLIGLNGIEMCIQEHAPVNHDTLLIQNAFGGQIYYGFKRHDHSLIQTGCTSIEDFNQFLQKELSDYPLLILGNGFQLYYDELSHMLAKKIWTVHDPLVTFPSIEYLGKKGYELWSNDPTIVSYSPIIPLYLKSYAIFSK